MGIAATFQRAFRIKKLESEFVALNKFVFQLLKKA